MTLARKSKLSMSMAGNASSKIPKGWPPDIVFLKKLVFSKSVPQDTINLLQSSSPASDNVVSGPNSARPPPVRIVSIEDPKHPANGQKGLFASEHLPPNTLILFYLGYVHTQAEADPDSDYDLSLDRELGLAVDATKMGNEARFINDYRGIGQQPNAEFRDAFVGVGKGLVEKCMAVYVLSAGKSGKRAKGIAKGEEILVSYGIEVLTMTPSL
jgi:hypothetical protein